MAQAEALLGDDAGLRGVVGLALAKWLNETDNLEKFVARAFEVLMEPEDEGYGRKKDYSRLESAIRHATGQVANETALALIHEHDEFKALIRAKVLATLQELLDDPDVVTAMVQTGLAAGIKNRGWG